MIILLPKEVFTQIDNMIKTPPRSVLTARQIAKVRPADSRFKDTLEFFYYTPKGSVEVYAAGGSASEIPIVNGEGGKVNITAHYLTNAYRVSESERDYLAEAVRQGRQPNINIIQNRVLDATSFIYRGENSIFFKGDPKLGLKGLLNFTQNVGGTTISINSAQVPETVANPNSASNGAGALAHTLKWWKNKTAEEILKDILAGRDKIASYEINGIPLFDPNTLIVPKHLYSVFIKPFSSTAPDYTLMRYLQDNKLFQNIWFMHEVSKKYVGSAVTATANNQGDHFIIMDNSEKVLEYGIGYDAQQFPEETQRELNNGNYTIPVRMKTFGLCLYHPTAIYRGDNIGDGNP